MLFSYRYVPHKMEKMQEFIDYIFHEVWCKASTSGTFSLNLFEGNSDLKEVMRAFYYSDSNVADRFYRHVEQIYGLFSSLDQAQVTQFRLWYQSNNELEKICNNDPTSCLARYADITPTYNDIGKLLASFFKELYSHSLLNLAPLKAKIGDINDHYQEFVKVNSKGKCPFCGITDLLTEYHEKRDAYDHYLPKGIYPFNSINFRNLVPACHHCNSSYKASKDPAFTPKDPARTVQRRKFFYPYSLAQHTIEISVSLKSSDVERLKSEDVDLHFGPAELKEEIETWQDVYSIKERYTAKCLGPDAKDWLEQVRILNRNLGVKPKDFIESFAEQTATSRFANSNFLKLAFLEGCERAGILKLLGSVKGDAHSTKAP